MAPGTIPPSSPIDSAASSPEHEVEVVQTVLKKPNPNACSNEYLCLLSAERINEIAVEYSISGVPSSLSYRIPSASERASSPSGEWEIAIYYEALIGGLRLPFPQLFVDIFNEFEICPSQLAPNSWKCLCGLVIVCLHGGIEPTVDRFKFYFGLSHERSIDWYFFGARPNRRFIGSVPSSLKGWKSKFFFVSSSETFQFQTKWGTPKSHPMEKRDLTPDEEDEYHKLLECFDLRVDSYLTLEILQASGLYTILERRPANAQASAGNLLSTVRAKKAQLRASKLEKRKRKESHRAEPTEESLPKKRVTMGAQNLNIVPEARDKDPRVPTMTPIEEVDSDDAVPISVRRFCVRLTSSVPSASVIPEPSVRERALGDAVEEPPPAHPTFKETRPIPEPTVPLWRSSRGQLRIEESTGLATPAPPAQKGSATGKNGKASIASSSEGMKMNPMNGLFFNLKSAAFSLELLHSEDSESRLDKLEEDEIAAHLRITAISNSILSDIAALLLEERKDLRLAFSLREGDFQNLKEEQSALKVEKDKFQASLDSSATQCQSLLSKKRKLQGKIKPLNDEIKSYRAAADEMIKTQQALEDRDQLKALTEENKKFQEDLNAKSALLDEANRLIILLKEEKEKLSSNVASREETLTLCADQIKEAEAICSSEKAGGYDIRFLAGVDFSTLIYKKGLKYLAGEDPNADSEDEWLEDPSSKEEGGAGANGACTEGAQGEAGGDSEVSVLPIDRPSTAVEESEAPRSCA
ncbi:hypothetical protein J5N97_017303 [Dioscorea zingiberensis]|uniref:Transposase (putative) gypsy type domain-containing protein n=1 Tax=Dioscorea zingiberensis TaxID=325984 RepID=A0A9D5CMZ2_9LILI|nr:hypothetical protein J5N97_017303 [Dioscorea zingiberensis]